MVTPYIPYPPSSGGQIRTFNLLKYLSKNNQIILVSLYKNEEEKKHSLKLKKYCQEIYFCQRAKTPWQIKNILKTIFSNKPFLIIRNYSSQAKKTIEKLIKEKKIDIIHAETFYVMPHIPKTKVPIFLVEQTIEYNVYRHFVNSLPFYLRIFLYFDIDILKLKYWEKYYWEKADFIIAVSSKDKEIIKKEIKENKVDIVPNCVGDAMIAKKLSKKSFKKPIIFFQGNFFWLQNVEAAQFLIKKIFPLLKKKIKNFQLIIAGQNTKKLNYKKDSQLKIIETINEKMVKDLYKKADIFICPIFGPGGTRLKILAAMGMGVPVISTNTGVEGLDLKDKENVSIANNEKEFIDNIFLLFNNQKIYQKIRKNAYQLIKKKYLWQQAAKKLENLYQKFVKIKTV